MKKFEQAKRLLNSLDNYRDPDDFSDEMISAVTADFDRLFELTWKFIKEYMQHTLMIKTAVTGSPRDILKIAYKERLIDDEDGWIELLKDRNDDTHHYNHGAAVLYVSRINDRYIDKIRKCLDDFKELIPEEMLPDNRLPESFFDSWKESGMTMDDFIEKIRIEKGYATKREVIDNWD
ncbi:MAG: nucleotidyltransferase substrate binding protein [Lachnospiraceae bacterium]|nr:nucleotidyltransferase substrate binding protein [Lachnospiraceae bacterium]